MSVSAIILAGGKSSRMGLDKGLTLLYGKALIQYSIDTLESMKLPILIISNNDDYKQFGYPVYPDLIPEKGPLGGIYTGLYHSENKRSVIVSCDTPFVSSEILNRLMEESSNEMVAISQFDGWEHPLIGIYDKMGIEIIKSMLDNNELKLSDTNAKLNAKVIEMDGFPDITERNFININTSEELNELENDC